MQLAILTIILIRNVCVRMPCRVLSYAYPEAGDVAITVVEMGGEYYFASTSATCFAEQHPNKTTAHRGEKALAVSSSGLAHISVRGANAVSVVRTAGELVDEIVGGTTGLQRLVDCTAFVTNTTEGFLLEKALGGFNLALTVLIAGLEPGDQAALHCIATTSPTLPVALSPSLIPRPSSDAVATSRAPIAVRSNDIVWVSGLCAKQANASDAFATLSQIVSMEKVLHCKFFLSNITNMDALFGGFYEVFNVGAPPPPSRGEFTTPSLDESCKVVVHCCAADVKEQEHTLT